jgi:hypothetical protein
MSSGVAEPSRTRSARAVSRRRSASAVRSRHGYPGRGAIPLARRLVEPLRVLRAAQRRVQVHPDGAALEVIQFGRGGSPLDPVQLAEEQIGMVAQTLRIGRGAFLLLHEAAPAGIEGVQPVRDDRQRLVRASSLGRGRPGPVRRRGERLQQRSCRLGAGRQDPPRAPSRTAASGRPAG